MNTLEFIASIVDSLMSLAWPIAVVIVARTAARAYSEGSAKDEE